jgi:hypothetical protein
VVDIAAGVTHGLALKSDGTVAPLDSGFAPPAGLSNVVQIAAGNGFSMALKSDGTVAVWATTTGATLGVTRIPVGLKHIAAIACGDYNCLAALSDGSASICSQPLSRQAAQGSATFLRVGATGDQPLQYQWHFNDVALTNATGPVLKFDSLQASNTGDYFVVIANSLSSVTSSVAKVTLSGEIDPGQVSLDRALGSQGLTWTTSVNTAWFGQSNVLFSGLPTAQSGRIGDSQQSSIQTSLSGPGHLDFVWKVSSEQFFDYLNFYLDGKAIAGISGEVNWEPMSLPIFSGPHSVRWAYEKDASTSGGLDSGWLAQVSYLPDFPVIVSQPTGQTSAMGASIVLSASALGIPPLTLQWFKDGSVLSGATSSSFVINSATRRNSGAYQMIASNRLGSASSVWAPVVVRVPQKLSPLPLLPGGMFRLLSADADGGILLPEDTAGFQAQVSTNLRDWVGLPSQLLLTNNELLLTDPLPAISNATRFYRITEQ